MDKFDIFVPHPLAITSLLPLECGCKPLVCLLKRHALRSLDFQDRSIRNYSCYTFSEGAVKWRVKQKKVQKEKEKNIWLTVFSSKNIDIHVSSFYHSWKFVFLREELSWIGVIWLNLPIEKSINCFSSLKVLFENQSLLSFFLATRLWKQDNDWYLKALHWGNERHHA